MSGGCTDSTMSASRTISSGSGWSCTFLYAASASLTARPAPDCRWICAPSLASLSATAGTIATRRSCGRVSLSTAILTGMHAPTNKGRNCGCLVPTGQHAHAPGDAIFPHAAGDDGLRVRLPAGRSSGRRPQQRHVDHRAVALLALSVLLRSLVEGRLAAWLTIPVLIGACWWLTRSSMHVLPLYLPPVLVPAFLAWIF